MDGMNKNNKHPGPTRSEDEKTFSSPVCHMHAFPEYFGGEAEYEPGLDKKPHSPQKDPASPAPAETDAKKP